MPSYIVQTAIPSSVPSLSFSKIYPEVYHLFHMSQHPVPPWFGLFQNVGTRSRAEFSRVAVWANLSAIEIVGLQAQDEVYTDKKTGKNEGHLMIKDIMGATVFYMRQPEVTCHSEKFYLPPSCCYVLYLLLLKRAIETDCLPVQDLLHLWNNWKLLPLQML